MASNPRFDKVLKEMVEIHNKKLADYANEGDPYANFKFAAEATGLAPEDVLLVLIGVKMARLRELLGTRRPPNFESIKDTKLDLAVYAALLLSLEDEYEEKKNA